ncbi:MAG TPA: acyl-CoA dehydrogenase family protein [Myxococcota bacterium]
MRTTDVFHIDHLLSDEERAVRYTVRRFVDQKVMPLVAQHYRDGTFPDELIPGFAELGLLGATLQGYGCAGMGPLSYWLALSELERADSGVRSFVSVQGSLCMFPIYTFGSDAQKEKWLPALAAGKKVGCFGLTEPDAGSDPASMRTRAKKVDGGWSLSGTKRWITNGTRADVAVVWGKTGDDAASIKGFIVERGMSGFQQLTIERKQSFRCSDTAELVMEDVFIPDANVLPGTKGLGSALKCLFEARGGIAYGVLGSAAACLESTIEFAKNRIAFGKPIAGMQLVQGKLATMATELTKAQLLSMQLCRLKEAGRVEPVHVSMAKMNNVKCALEIARTCRDILGANGITDEYPVMRHMCNLETVYTYEGTNDIHLLVIGQHLTGISAFR